MGSSYSPKQFEHKHFINGEYVNSLSSETYAIYNPKNGEILSESMAAAGENDVDAAVKAAEEALAGEWSSFTAQQRACCLHKLADLLEEKLAEILTFDSLSSGNPVSIIPTREKNYVITTIRYYAGWTDKHPGSYFPADDGFVKLVRHEPLGVCAAVNPFNAPIATLFFKAAPALATGNVIIVKPSEKTPLGSLALGPLFAQAGIPAGVVQILSGAGRTGSILASHLKIRKISFTGSIATGKKIQIAAAQSNLKRVTLELGGKSPAVVFEDADIENAITWTVNGLLARSGQVCVAATRVYVQDSIAEKFISRYTDRLKNAASTLGDPQDPQTQLGPLIDADSLSRVTKILRQARKDARLLVGGSRVGEKGSFFQPTAFLNPKHGAEIIEKEIFGPVSIIKTFSTEEEVLKLANDTEYGLMAGIFTKDLSRALRVSAKIDSGVVGINCVSYMNMQVPFGGQKQSGSGREFGEYALRAFTEPKTILINMNA